MIDIATAKKAATTAVVGAPSIASTTTWQPCLAVSPTVSDATRVRMYGKDTGNGFHPARRPPERSSP